MEQLPPFKIHSNILSDTHVFEASMLKAGHIEWESKSLKCLQLNWSKWAESESSVRCISDPSPLSCIYQCLVTDIFPFWPWISRMAHRWYAFQSKLMLVKNMVSNYLVFLSLRSSNWFMYISVLQLAPNPRGNHQAQHSNSLITVQTSPPSAL